MAATKPNQDTFKTSVVGDSGAAVFTSSRKELVRQGIPKEVIEASAGPPSTPFSMNTGNGTATVTESIGVSSDTFGSHECFLLPDCGMFLGAMGEVVQKAHRPFIWRDGQLPYFVTDSRKLKIYCPAKYRRYADRISNGVPEWDENMRSHPLNQATAEVEREVKRLRTVASAKGIVFEQE